MVTYDWRRCPYPTLEPDFPGSGAGPGEPGVPGAGGPNQPGPLSDAAAGQPIPYSYSGNPSGPISDQGPASGYGPMTSDLMRFNWGSWPGGELPDSLTGGNYCLLLGGVAGALMAWALGKKGRRR